MGTVICRQLDEMESLSAALCCRTCHSKTELKLRLRSLNAVCWILRRGPWVLGLAAEDRLCLGALGRPVMPFDLGFKLTRRPAGVAQEDPQTVHGLDATE